MKRLQRGFTLIELLVVIAVLAVLAAGVITAINPAKRIKQANDAKIKNDVGQIATGMQAYFTSSQYQTYPASVALLVTSGDLKVEPKTPAAASYVVATTAGANCTDTDQTTVCEMTVSAPLNDPKTTGNQWCWDSFDGKACEVLTGTGATGCSLAGITCQ